MAEIIDLSQEMYTGMPVYKGLPNVKISMYASHEQWSGIENPTTQTPNPNLLEIGSLREIVYKVKGTSFTLK